MPIIFQALLSNVFSYVGLITALQSIFTNPCFTGEETKSWLMLSSIVFGFKYYQIQPLMHNFFIDFYLYFHTLFLEKYTKFIMIEDNKENKDHSLERGRATLIFSLKNEVGGLIKALKIFQVSALPIFILLHKILLK